MHSHTNTHAHTHTHTHTFTHMNMSIHAYIHTHTYIHACIHSYIHTYAHAYMHAYIQTYIHPRKYTHTYMRTLYTYTCIKNYTDTYTHREREIHTMILCCQSLPPLFDGLVDLALLGQGLELFLLSQHPLSRYIPDTNPHATPSQQQHASAQKIKTRKSQGGGNDRSHKHFFRKKGFLPKATSSASFLRLCRFFAKF